VGGAYGPYYQSERLDRYSAAVQQLLDKGLAYWDYSKAEERAKEKEAAKTEKRPYVYSRRWMAGTPADRARFEAEGRTAAVCLTMPREGVCTFRDHIRGVMEFTWASEDDHAIARADGSPLYNLASVVDDHDMKITHVIRAEEHLSNTPRQIFIAQGLGYALPEYAHVPFVAEPGSKNKLSKRKIPQYLKNPDFKKVYEHGRAIAEAIGHHTSADTFNPVIVDFYREVGYLPDAILNYLVLLGWSLDDKTEEFSRDEMIRAFSLDRVNTSAASFDPKKLFAFQERYMQRLPLEQKTAMCLPYLQKAGLVPDPAPVEQRQKVTAVIGAANERIKVAGDVLDYRDFFVADEALSYDEAAFEKQLRKPADAAALLRKLRDRLAAAPAFDPRSLEALMNDFLQAEKIQLRQVQQALRVALTGKGVGFGLYETLAILGKDSSLRRIDQALARLAQAG
ncbi:MAG TPA: glutamate--tRNA ligase family protein, partial [Gemmataceae bacterium]|nr:glutamate--tRNA ligase family protein [Gemmataceae bacterium]